MGPPGGAAKLGALGVEAPLVAAAPKVDVFEGA